MEKSVSDYVKGKRKLFGAVTEPMGFIYNHRFRGTDEYEVETKKWVFTGYYSLDLQLRFFWLGAHVDIHNNTDGQRKSFEAYVKKIKLIDEMATEAYTHLTTGTGPLVVREFLNDVEVNDGFGATLFIHVDPDLASNYCVFEISSCYKKYRYGGPVKLMKVYLKNLLDFMYEVKDDLEIVKTKIDLAYPITKE